MEDVSIVGLDLAKRVFQVHGAALDGRVVCRKKLSRGQLVLFLRNCRRVWSQWNPVRQPISGPVRSARLAMRSGWCRPHT